ncbi:hypothetical protein [Streptomyces canus]|uniref:hypothetical protein n=1 Tax=Streptomyces canus TaxID=58343 RepID=UPI0032525466
MTRLEDAETCCGAGEVSGAAAAVSRAGGSSTSRSVVAPDLRGELLDLRRSLLGCVDALLLLLAHVLHGGGQGAQVLNVGRGDETGLGLGVEGLDGARKGIGKLLVVQGADVVWELERLGHERDSWCFAGVRP